MSHLGFPYLSVIQDTQATPSVTTIPPGSERKPTPEVVSVGTLSEEGWV